MITTWAEVETYFAGINEAVNLPRPDWAKAEMLLDELHTGGLPDEELQPIAPGESFQSDSTDRTLLLAKIRLLREGIAERDGHIVNQIIKEAVTLVERLKKAT